MWTSLIFGTFLNVQLDYWILTSSWLSRVKVNAMWLCWICFELEALNNTVQFYESFQSDFIDRICVGKNLRPLHTGRTVLGLPMTQRAAYLLSWKDEVEPLSSSSRGMVVMCPEVVMVLTRCWPVLITPGPGLGLDVSSCLLDSSIVNIWSSKSTINNELNRSFKTE